MPPRHSGALALLAVLLLAGCNPTSGSTAGAPSGNPAPLGSSTTTPKSHPAGAIPVGAGPQSKYTVAPQPPAGSCHYRYDKGEPLPDLACTPGAISPAVTQANIGSTICRKSGYTGGIRPPESVTGKEKRANAASYGYTGSLSDAEYDHDISLQLGGDPNDPRNLWVEPPDPGHKAGAGVNNAKDPVETKLHTAVCNGKITLAQAQQAIITDWSTALAQLGLG
ncbi:hypothetical protein [Actinacidiphila rubida]|uniref:Lipoprotein n=1 Tax=Actinacidiphila rubida TaxID=310780 RepID=A0A1H8U5M0_9ACTN|nr:hypothetical protein [Actinacidiphila rubida]SEO98529.1 hypothetical protein SAMN05216267_106432 [Actinacidiphila rubida]